MYMDTTFKKLRINVPYFSSNNMISIIMIIKNKRIVVKRSLFFFCHLGGEKVLCLETVFDDSSTDFKMII